MWQCVHAECPLGQGEKQLAVRDLWRSKQIYRSGSENLLISWTIWEWSLYSPGSAGRDIPKAAWLFRPEMPMALSGLRCQRRRWHASCGMQWERKSPCQLMYATAAVLSVRTSSSLPQKRPLRRFKARRTANNSRQLMCQCSWVPVQTPDTACPSCVALQPVVEGHYCVEKRISVWYGNYSNQDCKALQRVVRLAERISGSTLPSLQDIYLKCCKTRAAKIIKDSTHPGNHLFCLLPSGRRFRSMMAKTERLRRSFFPQAIRLLNTNSNSVS